MRHTLFATVAAVTIIASPAIAQPVVGSDPQFGPGSITGDPSQNLEILDLTVTAGVSVATMQTELLPGGTYEGWRYATLNEVVAFVNSFGWSPPITDAFEFNEVDGLLARTILDDFIGVLDSGPFGVQITTGYLQDESVVQLGYSPFGAEQSFFASFPGDSDFIGSEVKGHWLVRDVEPNVPMYQGILAESGVPFDGDADFRVTLSSGFRLPLETIEHSQVSVANGLFTIPLSFSLALFENTGATLRIDVRAPAGTGDFEPLTPDQPVSLAPIAIYALTAKSADFAAAAGTLTSDAAVPLQLVIGTEPYGVGYRSPVVSRSGNQVILNGLVRDVGISNEPGRGFAILPEGFRPTARLLFLQASSAGVYRIDVLPDGQLQFQGAPGVGGLIDWVSLDGISFTLE
ncbi:MAG: hypothetical protein AAGG07_02605 [Planctomycetota bacterium]